MMYEKMSLPKVFNNCASAGRFIITNMNNPQYISFLKIEAIILFQMKNQRISPTGWQVMGSKHQTIRAMHQQN